METGSLPLPAITLGLPGERSDTAQLFDLFGSHDHSLYSSMQADLVILDLLDPPYLPF